MTKKKKNKKGIKMKGITQIKGETWYLLENIHKTRTKKNAEMTIKLINPEKYRTRMITKGKKNYIYIKPESGSNSEKTSSASLHGRVSGRDKKTGNRKSHNHYDAGSNPASHTKKKKQVKKE